MRDRRWLVLALLGLAFLMTTLDGTILITALPSITAGLELSTQAGQWALTAYAVTFGGVLLLCGRMADLLGRRRIFLIGVGLRIGAALVCGFASSAGMLVTGRMLEGLSAAIIAPAALSMVTTAFAEGPERNRALGIWAGLGGVGATAGLLIGGVLTSSLGWQSVFFLNIPICLLVLALAPALLTESRGAATGRTFDVAGAVTITAALALLIYAVVSVPQAGWLSVRTIGTFLAVLALIAVFTWIESRSQAPLVPLRVLRSRFLVGGNLLMLTAGMSVDGMLVTLTGFLQGERGWSAARFGLIAAVMTVTSVGGALLAQRLVTRLGIAPVAAAGSALLAAACLMLSTGSIGVLIVALVVFGAGMGGFVGAQIAAFTGVEERDSGLAAGFIDTTFAIGTALGVAVCTSVALTAGSRAAFATAAAFGVCGLVIAVTLLRGGVNRQQLVGPSH